jgi:hypothetical protein
MTWKLEDGTDIQVSQTKTGILIKAMYLDAEGRVRIIGREEIKYSKLTGQMP